DVEPGAAFVLDHGHLETATIRPDRDRLDPAVDPDAVLEMDHEIAAPQGPGRRGGGRLAVAPRAPPPPSPAENLVIGEPSQAGYDESTVERAHHARGPLRVQQLVEPLELSLVVAQDHGGRLARHDLA